MGGIHRWPVDSPHKGPVIRNKFPWHDVAMVKYSSEDSLTLVGARVVRKSNRYGRTSKCTHFSILFKTTQPYINLPNALRTGNVLKVPFMSNKDYRSFEFKFVSWEFFNKNAHPNTIWVLPLPCHVKHTECHRDLKYCLLYAINVVTIDNQHWKWWWLDAEYVTSHHLHQFTSDDPLFWFEYILPDHDCV